MDGWRTKADQRGRRRPLGILLLLGLLIACFGAHAAHTVLGVGGSGLDGFFSDWMYNIVMSGAALITLARGVFVRAERRAWLAIGAGLVSWSIGELYWTIHLEKLDSIPFPSLADVFYLGLYPCFYVGLVLLVRARVPRFHASLWLDGAIGALATAAIGSALLYPAIQGSTGAAPATVVVNLAYPLCDLVLLSLVAGVLALSGWRPGRAWMLIAGGVLAQGIADGVFLYLEATGSYTDGSALDSLWLLGVTLVALAAWDPVPKMKRLPLQGRRLMLVPVTFGLIALVLLGLGTVSSINRITLGLATATLFVVLARMVFSFGENLRLADAAERASRAKSDFLANMSHELRTPLTAIIGFSEMMVEDSVEIDDADRVSFARRILSSGQDLRQLINDLLDISKVEAGMMDFHPELINLPALIEEVQETMRVLADNNRVELKSFVDPALIEVSTDRSKLKQVIYNYISNGIKFTPPGGNVTLFLESEVDDRFRVTVEDTGIGIREEDQEQLFREFHQVDSTNTRVQEGTGLGLALVRKIVEAQGGEVGVRSAPGRGSVFFAVLPRMGVERSAARAERGVFEKEAVEG